jgi:hypothetical protein
MRYEDFRRILVEALEGEDYGLTFKEIRSKTGICLRRVPGEWVKRLIEENIIVFKTVYKHRIWVLRDETVKQKPC